MARKGILMVVAATSGTGKSTVCQRVRQKWPHAAISISYTSRSPRQGEEDGVAYHFVSRETFEKMIAKDEFIEWAEVHDNYYGTSRKETLKMLDRGMHILLDIDVQGAYLIRKTFEKQSILLFLLPPSWDEMIRRLRDRKTETEAAIQRRIQTARIELPAARDFDYLVVNDNLDEAVSSVISILQSESLRTHATNSFLEKLIEKTP